jgi:hypothetical protein
MDMNFSRWMIVGIILLSTLAFSLNAHARNLQKLDDGVKIEMKPKVISNSDYDSMALGLEFSCHWQLEDDKDRALFGLTYTQKSEAELEGTISTNPDLNNKPISCYFVYGGYIDLYFPAYYPPKPRKKDDNNKNDKEDIRVKGKKDLDLGSLGWALGVGYEFDQEADDSNGYISGEILYVNDQETCLWFLIPSVVAALDNVWVGSSEQRDRINADTSQFQRLRLEALWKWKIGELLKGMSGLGWLVPVTLYADLYYFKEFNPEEAWENAGLDESTYFSGTVTYELDNEKINKYISCVFFQVSTGRIPPETDNSTNFMVGVEVPAEELLGMVFGSR